MSTTDATPLVHGILHSPVPFLPLLDEIPMAVLLLDARRRVVALNQAAEALVGFPSKRVLGLPCRHVLRCNLCVRECPLASLDGDSASVCVEGDIIDASRLRIPVRITASSVLDEHGAVVGFVEAVEDIRLLQNLEPRNEAAFGYAGIIGHSPKMENLFQLLPSVAQTDSSVLITGETGTGKDLVAEAIHQSSDRAKGPFVKVNCGALPETLLEGELFGHVKGAFTGAVENKSGRFKLAHNGTLFLTEVGDLPLPLQVKLLSFLDDKTFYPLGGSKPVKVDVRIIAATHRNLEQMVAQRLFREDLLYRLNVVRMHLPPLRERGEDLEMLTDHFLSMFRNSFGKKIAGFGARAREAIMRHPFPGNVRELRNVVEYAVNVCEGELVRVEHLPAYMTRPAAQAQAHAAPLADAAAPPAAAPLPVRPHAPSWEAAEHELIMDALVQAKGRRGRAAEILGWGRSTLWRKMKRHGID